MVTYKVRKWVGLATLSAVALASSTSASATGLWDWALTRKGNDTPSAAQKKQDKRDTNAVQDRKSGRNPC